jgi:hypothetical protein
MHFGMHFEGKAEEMPGTRIFLVSFALYAALLWGLALTS